MELQWKRFRDLSPRGLEEGSEAGLEPKNDFNLEGTENMKSELRHSRYDGKHK